MQVVVAAEVRRVKERERKIQWIEAQNAQAVPPLHPILLKPLSPSRLHYLSSLHELSLPYHLIFSIITFVF